MAWGAVGGAAIGAGASLLGGKDSPDLQPWARVGEGMKRNYFPRVNEFADNFNADSLWSGSRLAAERVAVPHAQRQMLDSTGRWNDQVRGNADTIEGFLNYDPNSPINQARRDAFSEQAMTNFDRNIRPAIEDRGTFGGQFGGPQQALAIGAAGADTMRDINTFEAQMMEADRNRALQASGMAGNIFAQQMQPLLNKEAIGNRQTARNQLELEDRILQQESPYLNSQRTIMDLAGMYNPFSGLGFQGSVGGENPLQSALGFGILGSQLQNSGVFDNLFGATQADANKSFGGGAPITFDGMFS